MNLDQNLKLVVQSSANGLRPVTMATKERITSDWLHGPPWGRIERDIWIPILKGIQRIVTGLLRHLSPQVGQPPEFSIERGGMA